MSARHIVRAIIGLAQSLTLETIADGVETAEQRQVLQTLGCDTGQGYHFSRPVPPAQLETFLRGRPPKTP